MRLTKQDIPTDGFGNSLSDLYLAYRKAKADAFYENTHFHALAYAEYERKLDQNLRRLVTKLADPKSTWASDAGFLGGYVYAPKGVEQVPGDTPNELHHRAINPEEEWRNRFVRAGRRRGKASFRLMITPTVDFQILSALWILKIGTLFDSRLSAEHSFGNRLRRVRSESQLVGVVNRSCAGLFPPYFSAYKKWRETGLRRMKDALLAGRRVIAVTMDVRRFYHQIDPRFILDARFHRALRVKLTSGQAHFSSAFVRALRTWYRSTPDHSRRPTGLPVGLSASKIIANVLLKSFDDAVASRLNPIYYGRYVDDVFLVLPGSDSLKSGADLMKWMAKRLRGVVARKGKGSQRTLQFLAPYMGSSEIAFSSDKQKVFDLSGPHGLDLIGHINSQIRAQSSEYRLLPELPRNGGLMAKRALLATPDATLEADALRKADVVSVRRLGFAFLMRDVEAYARDLTPGSWKSLREEFYGLVSRHVLTPQGFFDYSVYLHRVFGVMVACRDMGEARAFIEKLDSVGRLLRQTTNAGTSEQKRFKLCLRYYGNALRQAAIQASTVSDFDDWRSLSALIKKIDSLANVRSATIARPLVVVSRQVLLADWGRRAYKEYWYHSQKQDLKGPMVPRAGELRRLLRIGGIRNFRKRANIHIPYWPALAFPTRPLTIAEMSLFAPKVLEDPLRIRDAVMALRGAQVVSRAPLGIFAPEKPGRTSPGFEAPRQFFVPDASKRPPRFAVTSYKTTYKQWERAVRGRPDRSLYRYQGLSVLINKILRERVHAKYVTLPEASLPKAWAPHIAAKLAQSGMSLLAGLETYYDRRSKRLRNDAFVSLTTDWPGYPTHVVHLQPKRAPAHEERAALKKLGAPALYEPKKGREEIPVYVHNDFFLGVLLCSDLTDIANRRRFQGFVDAVAILEWNRDIGTFTFLVESAAHDIHAYIIQVNNRRYGDSRIRAPLKKEHQRDVVRVKGGLSDYYVLAAVDHRGLREFQRQRSKGARSKFKPTPIGFKMSPWRALAVDSSR